MKKAILLFSLIFSIGLFATNEPATLRLLSGKIIDKQTGETLAGVKVQIKGTDAYCFTNMDGTFALSVNATNSAGVVIDLVGYESTTFKTQELFLGSEIVLNPR